MDPVLLIIILLTAAAIILVAELLLPSGGLLAIAGAICVIAAIVVAFRISETAGVVAILCALVAGPVVFKLGFNVWKASPIGKRMIITQTVGQGETDTVPVGSVGTTLSVLRPMGEADFDGITVQALSEVGPIAKGTRVRVIESRTSGVVIVRPET